MKIKSVEATWLHVPIPEARQHVSDFGRMASFDSVLVRIETECGIAGYGEAKEEVGSANCHALVAMINRKAGGGEVQRQGRHGRDTRAPWARAHHQPRFRQALRGTLTPRDGDFNCRIKSAGRQPGGLSRVRSMD